MVAVINYDFKTLTDKIVKQKESFINSYVDRCLKSKGEISSIRKILRVLDANY